MAEAPGDLRPSPARRLIVGVVAVALIVGIGVFVVMLLRSEPANPVCDHVADLAKTNPREADNFVDAIAGYVARNIATQRMGGHQRSISDVDGDTPDERCHSAMGLIEHVADDAGYRKLTDCLTHVTTSRDARTKCLGE